MIILQLTADRFAYLGDEAALDPSLLAAVDSPILEAMGLHSQTLTIVVLLRNIAAHTLARPRSSQLTRRSPNRGVRNIFRTGSGIRKFSPQKSIHISALSTFYRHTRRVCVHGRRTNVFELGTWNQPYGHRMVGRCGGVAIMTCVPGDSAQSKT